MNEWYTKPVWLAYLRTRFCYAEYNLLGKLCKKLKKKKRLKNDHYSSAKSWSYLSFLGFLPKICLWPHHHSRHTLLLFLIQELCPKTEYFQGNWNFKLKRCHNTLKIIFYSYKKYLKICIKSTLINNYDNIHPKNERQFYPVIFRTVS